MTTKTLNPKLIEAVDAWFAQNTGLGGCSDKDVAELAAIFSNAAVPEPTIHSSEWGQMPVAGTEADMPPLSRDKQPIIELARQHGATSYVNRADTAHPAYGFTEVGLIAFARHLTLTVLVNITPSEDDLRSLAAAAGLLLGHGHPESSAAVKRVLVGFVDPLHQRMTVQQHSDQMECHLCWQRWDVNDPNPPSCFAENGNH